MSTLSGQASKGEKPKSKFQSLDINSLYKHSRGENLEKTQQKSSLTYVKHGMQSLGKVPSARRPPANLPSLKSEHSGSDAAVPLVPPGAPGWGKQDGQTTSSASSGAAINSATLSVTNSHPQAGPVAATTPTPTTPQLSTHQQNIALPVTTTIPPQPKQQQQQQPQQQQSSHNSSSASNAGNTDKLWSSVMSGSGVGGVGGGQDAMHPPPYHSAQFQHEFPSLAGDGSGGAATARGGGGGGAINSTATGGGGTANNAPNEYPPAGGVSLRPQTEGSWTQGGGRSGLDGVPKNGSAPLAVPPHLSGQVGPPTAAQTQQAQQTLPPQFRGVMPPFMYKGSNFAQGNIGNSLPLNGRNSGPGTAAVPTNRPTADNRPPRLVADADEITPRPIIKEEELNLMDDIGHDMGWAVQDDIDYNQKLEFSDEEIQIRKPRKEMIHKKDHPDDLNNINMNNNTGNSRSSGWTRSPTTRGRVSSSQDDEDNWVQQRKRTEKDIELVVQRAIQRKEEEEKRFNETTKQGAQKKLQELEEKIQKRQSVGDDKSYSDDGGKKSSSEDNGSSFRALTQIEGKSFPARRQQNAPKESSNREPANAPNFSKQFQNDLPPRFRGHRNNAPSSAGGSGGGFNEGRWKTAPSSSQQRNSPHDDRDDELDRDRENRAIRSDYKRQSSEDSYRSSHHSQSDKTGHDVDDKLDWHENRRGGGERPQRPDSRDSRSTRHSRDSEPRDYLGSWSESYESGSYEEKRRDREERSSNRPVPGPITKERIEADDMRSEKRNLTQLKRGIESKSKTSDGEGKNDKGDDKKEESTAWADAIPSGMEQADDKSNLSENKDKIIVHKEKDDKDRRGGGDKGRYAHPKSGGWDSNYRNTSYTKPRPSRGHSKPGIGRSSSSISGSGEMHATDSEDDHKKDKDERNRETKMDKMKSDKKEGYVPRGEPTRHGRGGSTAGFRSSTSSRMGMSKRIDGYGPPPSKSPFGHSHEEKKMSSDEANDSHHDDKAKQNQQALSAGLSANQSRKNDDLDKKNRLKGDRRPATGGKFNKSGKKELEDESDENSDEKSRKGKSQRSNSNSRSGPPRRAPLNPRVAGSDKRTFKKEDKPGDGHEKDVADEKEEKAFNGGDAEGFQEVKSKKTPIGLKKDEPVKSVPAKPGKFEKDKPINPAKKMTQQQIQNIPSLMATPINPPPSMAQQSQKGQFERPRQNMLAPRFARQKMQKQQMQKHPIGSGDDMKMSGQSVGSGYVKESQGATAATNNSGGAAVWGEAQIGHDILNVGVDAMKANLDVGDKNLKLSSDKALLDGSTPPVNTIIFENTNFKSAPGGGNRNNRQQQQQQQQQDKSGRKLDENIDNSVVMGGFNKSMDTILNKSEKDAIQLPLSFKDDNADMKLDFFDSDLSHLTDDKKNLSKSIQITSASSTICTADSLNIKIASVKKVWETPSEHTSQDEANSSFSNSFDPNTLDPNVVFKGTNDNADDSHHEGYSPSPNQAVSTSTNVCKVKPTQQVPGGAVTGQAVLSSSNHQQQGIVASGGLMGNPLSPPPSAIPPVIGAGVGMAQAPQQYPASQHIGYQTSLGGNTQYGMSAIPSPPTVPVLYNSTQQALQAQTGLYGAFQIDQLGGQGRSQYSQYPNHYGLGQTASSPYSTQSVYLPATPPHPPPQAAQAPPELYPNMSNYRLSATAPFGQNQQLNNPTTVLISSTSNSLMSASVKPSNQPISAIGTKTGGVGQAYQQQSQQGQQVAYMAYDPSIPANYLSNAGVAMQRGPPGPVQNNVVPAALQSSSYYSGSTGGQTGYFQQPGNSTIPSAPLQQHQASYGLQGNVFGTHNQSHTNTAGLQNYSSHFLSTPMQMAAALNAQQYRTGMPYMKNVGAQQIGGGGGGANDQNRPQQLKSPSSQEGFSSVFNSGPQIPSPKSKQNAKHPPPQSSPTAQHKYNLYQNVGGHQGGNVQNRFPTPIQRPNVNYQQGGGLNMKHNRNNNPNNKGPNRQYYTNQNLNQGHDKVDDGKLDSSAPNANSAGKNTVADVKDNIKKQEEAALKD